MNLDLSVASLVRASSGALMAAFGLYLLTVRPGTARSRALGAYHLALGPVFVFTNLLRFDLAALAWSFLLSGPLFLAAGAALVALAWGESRGEARARAALLAFFVLLLGGNLAAAALVPSDVASTYAGSEGQPQAAAALNEAFDHGRYWYAFLNAAAPAAVLALALRFHASGDAVERRRVALLAVAVGAYPLFDKTSGFLLEPASHADGWLSVPAFGLAAAAWALVARGPAAPAARNASLALAFAGIVGFGAALAGDDYGLLGVARLAGLAMLAYAVFRLDLLGIHLQPRTVRQGSVATIGLAALFIVAQVAQEFFEAEYGLLMGGLVAGALLFAARPIERAMEGRRMVPAAVPAQRGADGGEAREAAYRKAVRFALRDRALTREEELNLHEIAEQLGIGGRRAHAILAEVEREMGVEPR